MTTLTDDWVEHTWPIKLKCGAEYSVRLWVYLTLKEVPDDYHWPNKDTQVAGYTLETFDCLPACPPEHEKEIEKQLLELLEEEYGT